MFLRRRLIVCVLVWAVKSTMVHMLHSGFQPFLTGRVK